MSTESVAPNPADFSANERPNEYEVTFDIRGSIRTTITADSKEAAKAKALAMLNEDDFGMELDEVDEVDVSFVYKSVPMYRVTREGDAMQVSHLLPGDIPRQPKEDGF